MYGSLKEVQIGNFLLVGKCIQWDRTFGLTVKERTTTLTGCTFLIVGFYMIRLLFKLSPRYPPANTAKSPSNMLMNT